MLHNTQSYTKQYCFNKSKLDRKGVNNSMKFSDYCFARKYLGEQVKVPEGHDERVKRLYQVFRHKVRQPWDDNHINRWLSSALPDIADPKYITILTQSILKLHDQREKERSVE